MYKYVGSLHLKKRGRLNYYNQIFFYWLDNYRWFYQIIIFNIIKQLYWALRFEKKILLKY